MSSIQSLIILADPGLNDLSDLNDLLAEVKVPPAGV
jgi:hypothetical protein